MKKRKIAHIMTTFTLDFSEFSQEDAIVLFSILAILYYNNFFIHWIYPPTFKATSSSDSLSTLSSKTENGVNPESCSDPSSSIQSAPPSISEQASSSTSTSTGSSNNPESLDVNHEYNTLIYLLWKFFLG